MPDTAIDIYKHQAEECLAVIGSFLHFVLNYCWIEDKETSQPIQFKLWASQRRILKAFLTAYRLIILKARQLGLTWLCAAYALWLCITKPLQLVVVISAKEDWAIEFLDRVKFILDRLPDWMIPEVTKRTGQTLEFRHNGNLLSTIKSLATTPEGAQSKTPTLLILDETARNRYIKEIWAASKPGIDVAKGRIILISNSIKDGVGWGWTRDIFTKSMLKVNDFVRIFMPWWDRPGRSTEIVYDEDTKTEIPFFIKQQKDEGMDEEDISQHYPSTEQEAISAMLGSYFGKTLAKYQPHEGEKGFLEVQEDGKLNFIPDRKGILEIWEHPEINADYRYSVGSDISEGLGQSYSVAYVYDRLTKKLVAKMRSNRIEADIWADKLIELSKYYGNAYIAPERNGAGITTIQRLIEKYVSYLFYREVPGKIKGQYVNEYGWQETNANKHILAADLKTYFRTVFLDVPCGILLDECSTFIRHENGKLEHEEGKFDDCVIGAALAIQCDLMMPPVVPLKPEKRQSMFDKRIDALKRGNTEDYEEYIIQETIQQEKYYGIEDDFDYGEMGYFDESNINREPVGTVE